MLLVGQEVANGLKGGEVGISDVEHPLNILNGFGLAPGVGLPVKFPAFRQILLTSKGCCGSEYLEVVSPLSPVRSSFDRHHNGCSSRSSNLILRSPSNIDFEKSFLVLVASFTNKFFRVCVFISKTKGPPLALTLGSGVCHPDMLCSPHLQLWNPRVGDLPERFPPMKC
eukprot:Gb_40495 [translate_table: standard]